MIFIKDGARFTKLIPAIYSLFPIIDGVWDEHVGFSATIETVINDTGIGLRTINLSTVQRQTIFEDLQRRFIPYGYAVEFRKRNEHGEHIFIGKE